MDCHASSGLDCISCSVSSRESCSDPASTSCTIEANGDDGIGGRFNDGMSLRTFGKLCRMSVAVLSDIDEANDDSAAAAD